MKDVSVIGGGGVRALQEEDPELHSLIRKEKERQLHTVELIASENFTSRAVMECMGSCLTNKYAEGYPSARYYGGTEVVDEIELLCQRRCLAAFKLSPDEWGVNVQPYSGSPANFEVYTALLQPHDRIMGLDLPSGGHLTHGFYTAKKRVSASSIFFESMPYVVNDVTGLIDYDALRKTALLFKPKLIIAGMSAYPRELDYKRFRDIADEVGCYLMSDMAHVSGLVAAGLQGKPFEYSDVVTTTTHKTLRGPRSGLIFFNKKRNPDFELKINGAVFPTLQGGPHVHQIAAIACQMKEVATAEWGVYANKVVSNCKALADTLQKRGYKLATDGTDNHLILVDLRPQGLTGAKMQILCDEVGMTLNKNSICGDRSALIPSGIRIGTPAMTSRGMQETDFEKIGEYLHATIELAKEIQKAHGTKLADFQAGISKNSRVAELGNEIRGWVSQFPMPGGEAL